MTAYEVEERTHHAAEQSHHAEVDAVRTDLQRVEELMQHSLLTSDVHLEARITRCAVLSSAQKSKLRALFKTFNGWRGLTWRLLLIRFALNTLFARHAAKALLARTCLAWRAAVQHKARVRQHTANCVAAMLHRWHRRLILSAYTHWAEFIQAELSARQRLQVAVRKLHMLRVILCFNCWCDFVEHIRKLKAQTVKLMQRMQNLTLAAAIGAWLHFTEHNRKLKAQIMKLMQRMQNLTLAAAMDAWLHILHHERGHRKKLQAVILRMRNAALAATFVSWLDATQRAAHSHRVVQKIMLRVRNLLAAQCFDALLSHKRKMEIARSVIHRWRQRLLSCMFLAFADFVADEVAERKRTAAREELQGQFFQASGRVEALQQVLKARDAKIASSIAQHAAEIRSMQEAHAAKAATAIAQERHAREVARVEMIQSLASSLSPRGGSSPGRGRSAASKSPD
jgi:hypothetical protein